MVPITGSKRSCQQERRPRRKRPTGRHRSSFLLTASRWVVVSVCYSVMIAVTLCHFSNPTTTTPRKSHGMVTAFVTRNTGSRSLPPLTETTKTTTASFLQEYHPTPLLRPTRSCVSSPSSSTTTTTSLWFSLPGFDVGRNTRRNRGETEATADQNNDNARDNSQEDVTANDNENVDKEDEEVHDTTADTATTTTTSTTETSEELSRRQRIRKRVTNLARRMVIKPITNAAPLPQAIASVLKDATLNAVDMAVEEVITGSKNTARGTSATGQDGSNGSGASNLRAYLDQELDMADAQSIIDEAFLPLENSLQEAEESLLVAKEAMEKAKSRAMEAMGAVQAAAIAQAEGAASAVAAAEEKVIADIFDSATAPLSSTNISELSFDDVEYDSSEMAPPFIGEDQCLVPGEPVVRVEKAPENSRRIFAGVDIMASVDDVWNVLTKYDKLQDVIPNLVVNDVLNLYNGQPSASSTRNERLPEEEQCRDIASSMKGALLRQVGGAKVVGINFSARTTLEVREWPQGMPDFAHFNDELWEGKNRGQRAKEYARVKLQRYCFPRPFALSSLPTRDISMQSVENDDGEFRMYQGVWRMQPLPGCAPEGQEAMRLTYAVEVSPRAYLPVQLIEGRIVRDLCTNLEAIRDFVS